MQIIKKQRGFESTHKKLLQSSQLFDLLRYRLELVIVQLGHRRPASEDEEDNIIDLC